MSSRGLLRAMTITGSTQAVNVILSIARLKVLALLLGPAGVGVLSIYNNLMTTTSTFAGLGLGNSGVRQIAQARGDDEEFGRVRRVLLAANLLQGALAMGAIWLLREPIANWLFGEPGYELETGLVGIAVLLTLVTASQTALLRGMRRIGDLGRITVFGALVATIGGIAAVWTLGMDGLLWFVLLQPLTAVLVAALYTRKLPKGAHTQPPMAEVWRIWKPMVRLGIAFMLGGLASGLVLLVIRGRIAGDLGLEAAGQFAAAWGITMTYVGFLLNAMGMDYYPRLAEIIHDRTAAIRLMNEQMQIGLAIGGPVLLLLIGLAPAAITILYSAQFGEAITLLQWQTAGNVFKLACWPVGFAFAAAARSQVFLFTRLSFHAIFFGLVWLGLPLLGLEIAGMAFLAAYVIHFTLLNLLAHRLLHFRWEPLSLRLLIVHGGLALSLLALSLAFPMAGVIIGAILAVGTGFVGGHILLAKIGPSRRTAPLARVYAACGWPVGEQA